MPMEAVEKRADVAACVKSLKSSNQNINHLLTKILEGVKNSTLDGFLHSSDRLKEKYKDLP